MKTRQTLLAAATAALAAFSTTGAVAQLVFTESGDNAYDLSGTIPAYEEDGSSEFSGVQCVEYFLSIYPEDATVAAGILTPENADAINDTLEANGYASEAEFLADAAAKAVAGSLCAPNDFVDGVCSGKVTSLIPSQEYTFSMVSGYENTTEITGRFESCDEAAVEGTETFTEIIKAGEGIDSEPFDNVTCVKYTFTTTPGAEITAGLMKNTTFDSIGASLSESSTIDQIINAFVSGAETNSLCLPANFTDGVCSQYVPTLDANTAYVVAAGNAGDTDSQVTINFALCPNTVDVETQTTVEIAGDISAEDEEKTATAIAKAMLRDDYSEDTKLTMIRKYEVKGKLTYTSEVSEAGAKFAIATKMNVNENSVDVTITSTARRRRLLAGSTVDYTLKTTSRTVANTARRTAATATDISIDGVAGTPDPSAAKIAATVIVKVEVPKEKAMAVAETVALSDFEAAVASAVQTETGNTNLSVQAGSTKTNTDVVAAVEDLNNELGIAPPPPPPPSSGAERRASVVASVVFGFVATALLQ